jgi:hypothetical protein
VAADLAVAMLAPPQRSPDGAIGLLVIIPNGAPQDASTTDLVLGMRTRSCPAPQRPPMLMNGPH